MASEPMDSYPLTYDVEYPEQGVGRVSTLFRLFLIIPSWIVDGLLAGTTTLPLVLMLLFRKKYPRWWFDFNLERARFSARVGVYSALMTDQYPSTDETQSVSLDFEYPDPSELNRFLPLLKWLLALPHHVILYVFSLLSLAVTVIAWFAIILTGKYPRALFGLMVGFQRWSWRVTAYTALLITDRYPPFRMS